jgi:hypothetical protein
MFYVGNMGSDPLSLRDADDVELAAIAVEDAALVALVTAGSPGDWVVRTDALHWVPQLIEDDFEGGTPSTAFSSALWKNVTNIGWLNSSIIGPWPTTTTWGQMDWVAVPIYMGAFYRIETDCRCTTQNPANNGWQQIYVTRGGVTYYIELEGTLGNSCTIKAGISGGATTTKVVAYGATKTAVRGVLAIELTPTTIKCTIDFIDPVGVSDSISHAVANSGPATMVRIRAKAEAGGCEWRDITSAAAP